MSMLRTWLLGTSLSIISSIKKFLFSHFDMKAMEEVDVIQEVGQFLV